MEGQSFELCENCKFLAHQGTTCLENYWKNKDAQSANWACRLCGDQNYVVKNTPSYYVACDKNHYFCCVCGHEFNKKSHEICRILYSQLPSFS